MVCFSEAIIDDHCVLTVPDWYGVLSEAAASSAPVRGLTHGFYRYPARFSPEFAGAAIELFSREGEAVLDPFMGGGTTVVEALARGRQPIGTDINELALFITRAKTTFLTDAQLTRVERWFQAVVEEFDYRLSVSDLPEPSPGHSRNLTVAATRPVKKCTRYLLGSLARLSTNSERLFARCVILKTAQWALDGRRHVPTLNEFGTRLLRNCEEMVLGMLELESLVSSAFSATIKPELHCTRAELLTEAPPFAEGKKVGLVVTSPPYPGVHVLYHRWQVHGRRETAAPYWIAASRDGMGSAYYNFGDRRDPLQQKYFAEYRLSLHAIRSVMKLGGVLVQMVACKDPERQLPALLECVNSGGFSPLDGVDAASMIRRDVPGRKWYATMKGAIASAKEVVLVHAAK